MMMHIGLQNVSLRQSERALALRSPPDMLPINLEFGSFGIIGPCHPSLIHAEYL